MAPATIYHRSIPKGACLAFNTITQNFHSNWHAHPEFEIVYIESGWGTIQYGEQQKQYQKNDILLLAPWIPHEFLEKSKNHSSISLLFNYNFIAFSAFDCQLSQEIREFLKKSSAGMRFHGEMLNTESDMIKLILSHTGLEQAINLYYLLKKLSLQTEVDFLGSENTSIAGGVQRNYAKLQDILYFINKEANRELMVDDVAGKFYMSRSHFSRFFQKYTGKTFLQYLLKIRIERASDLLVNTEMPITLISDEVGFNSLTSFNRGFLKIMKQTPSHYRKYNNKN